MSHFGFLTERLNHILLSVCEGKAIKEIAAEENISRSRVDQLLNRACRRVWAYIDQMNSGYEGPNESHILNILYADNSALSLAKNIIRNAFIYKAFIQCSYTGSLAVDLLPVRRLLENYQKTELAKVNEEWREITRRICWGESAVDLAKELGMTEYDVAKIVHLTCYVINPSVYPSDSYYWNDYNVCFFQEHKRCFFDQVEFEINYNLFKYLPILDYLEEGEVACPVTLPYLQQLFERKNQGISIAVFMADHQRQGRVEFAHSPNAFQGSKQCFEMIFDNGMRKIPYHDRAWGSPRVYISVCRNDYMWLEEPTDSRWVGVILSTMRELAHRRQAS